MSDTTSADYKVPGEPGVYYCARHKNVKTRLRCGRCEKPICPKCTKMGPTGARCNDCLSNKSSHMYQVGPLQFAAAFGVAFGCSLIAGFLTLFVGIFVIFYAPVVGTFIGKAVLAVVKGKRGTKLAVTAGAGVAIGALMPVGSIMYGGGFGAHVMNPFLWIYIVLAISGVWYWIR